MASNDGSPAAASLLDVAIRAAVQAGAPRRTVAATAAAVASVVMVELRGGAGAHGKAAAPPTASQKRRIKRKKKAMKEKLAASESLALMDVDEKDGGLAGEAEATVPSSQAAIGFNTVEQPPVLSPSVESLQNHNLDLSGHGNIGGLRAGGGHNSDRSHSTHSYSTFRSSSPHNSNGGVTLSGGVANSASAGFAARSSSGAVSTGHQHAKLKTRKWRGNHSG